MRLRLGLGLGLGLGLELALALGLGHLAVLARRMATSSLPLRRWPSRRGRWSSSPSAGMAAVHAARRGVSLRLAWLG